jgi:hypothetical protein
VGSTFRLYSIQSSNQSAERVGWERRTFKYRYSAATPRMSAAGTTRLSRIIPCTWFTVWLVLLLKSTTDALPPCFKTRWSSLSALGMSETFLNLARLTRKCQYRISRVLDNVWTTVTSFGLNSQGRGNRPFWYEYGQSQRRNVVGGKGPYPYPMVAP